MLDTYQKKYLEALSEEYPTTQAASTEIINLNAILNLPKGTEHFMSDIHGEDEAFCHILNNASGAIRKKVDELFINTVSSKERNDLCTLVYYPKAVLKEMDVKKEDEKNEWYHITLYRVIELCRACSSKYTRSKVRKALPKDFEYIIDELLHADEASKNKQKYYENIVSTIISLGRADAFIIALSDTIKRLVVDRLHIVGDIFDRGPHADVILDRLIAHHAVDIQWGNHDVLWMGAASGSPALIACVLNISTRYDNIDFVENAYGINLRPLALFARKTYKEDSGILSHMHKAIAIMQFKLEGQIIKRHPEFNMDDRLLLEAIDYETMVIHIDGKKYALNDDDFPTIDPKDPHKLSDEEQQVMKQLVHSFSHSEKLQKHVRFLYSCGSIYKVYNRNLMFHGCIPMEPTGDFASLVLNGKRLQGKKLMDHADIMVRQAYYLDVGNEKQHCQDFVWYLWCGRKSPLFGRDRMTTFERMFLDEEALYEEVKDPYYEWIEQEETCRSILLEFGLTDESARIVNGHVPVLAKEGEMPLRGGGKLVMIDGGFSRPYQSKTGIAGYTMIYNSYGIRLVSHQPFPGREAAIHKGKDIISSKVVFDSAEKRILVRDTDTGGELMQNISDLTDLLRAYRNGCIKEKR